MEGLSKIADFFMSPANDFIIDALYRIEKFGWDIPDVAFKILKWLSFNQEPLGVQLIGAGVTGYLVWRLIKFFIPLL